MDKPQPNASEPSKEKKEKEYPPELIESIKRGMDEIRQGKGIPHSEVMKRYEKWLK